MTEYRTRLCCLPFLNIFFHKRYYFHCNKTSFHKAPKIKPFNGTWIDFYNKILILKGKETDKVERRICRFEGCQNTATIGAHIRKSYSFHDYYCDWYIVRSCAKCNNQRGKACKIKKGTYIVKVLSKRFFIKKNFIKKKKSLFYFLSKIKIKKI